MPRRKVHKYAYTCGVAVAACDMNADVHTTFWEQVTCRKCLRKRPNTIPLPPKNDRRDV